MIGFNSISEVKKSLLSKKISVEELFDLAHKVASENKYNEFITVLKKEDLKNQIAESQKRIEQGDARPLEGIPIAVKDNFCTSGIKTTAGSKMLSEFVPFYDSEVTNKLKDAGSIFIGKTNMDEFGMGSETSNQTFGDCLNPYPNPKTNKHNLVPGGSSGGSAVSVKTKSSFVSLGTDTGGSVRQPAAFCGLYGMKPTYGMVSRYGVIAFASSFDQVGLFANNPSDLALCFNQISGHDKKDSTTVSNKISKLSDFSRLLKKNDATGYKIATIDNPEIDKVDPEILGAIENVCERLEKSGAKRESKVNIKHFHYAPQIYHTVAAAESFSNLSRFDGIRYGTSIDSKDAKSIEDLYLSNRTIGFGKEVKRRIGVGSMVLSSNLYESHFVKGTKFRRLLINEFENLFKKIDVLIIPTTIQKPHARNEEGSSIDAYLNDVFTFPASCCGLPCISIPVNEAKNGLPIGVQLVSRWFSDDLLLMMADLLKR